MGLGPPSATKPMPVEIDDPEDLHNATVRKIIRTGPKFRVGKRTFVIGHGVLSPAWQALTFKPISLTDAQNIVSQAEAGGLTTAKQRVLASTIARMPATATTDAIRAWIADELLNGELWAILHNATVEKGKADPAVYAAVNGTFGTKIDFVFLAQWEGGQYLHGYVPFSKGTVAGGSGVTIATGFDIGQKSAGEITSLKFGDKVEPKLMPFSALKLTGKTRAQVIATIVALKAPVPIVTKTEADTIDRIVHSDIVEGAVSSWNKDRKTGVPSFAQLPEPWQTVLCSRFFHQGKYSAGKGPMKKFWASATAGDWEQAITDLTNYPVSQPWYKARVRKEAQHLRVQLPPPVVQPPKPAAKPGAKPGVKATPKPAAAKPAAGKH